MSRSRNAAKRYCSMDLNNIYVMQKLSVIKMFDEGLAIVDLQVASLHEPCHVSLILTFNIKRAYSAILLNRYLTSCMIAYYILHIDLRFTLKTYN